MALAIRTGIAPSVWAAEGVQAINTAYELIAEMDRPPSEGPEQGTEAPAGWE